MNLQELKETALRLKGMVAPGPVDSILLPRQSRHDDVYIASFPKSGNTWLGFMLANLQIIHLGKAESVNFFNARRYVPDLHQSRDVAVDLGLAPFPRFLKIHSRCCSRYNMAVLLVRDPREALVSYYHFSRALYSYQGSISEFIRSERHGAAAWLRHTDSWVTHKNPGTRLHIMKYEQLLADPVSEMSQLMNKIGIELTSSTIEAAVEQSAFDKMQAIEQATNSDLLDPQGYRFVRSASTDSYKAALSQADQVYIETVAAGPMRYFGYLGE